MPARRLALPTVLAVAVTLANAAKPVVVDDAAYLTFARHIAAHPLDPYGFEMFWYTAPEPAMNVLAPPVVPYWLAAGVALFGEHVGLLKLSLFPFVWLLAVSLAALLRRFARGAERPGLILLMLSPAVLPTVNLMLDGPALALGLAAVLLFLRAADRGSWRPAVAAGLVGGLAVQTKYTMLVLPAVVLWAGVVRRRFPLAVVAVVVGAGVFAGWERLLVARYGESHFVHHVRDQQAADGGEPKTLRERAEAVWDAKSLLGLPLLAHLGAVSGAVGLWAARAVGVPRWLVAVAAGGLGAGVILVALLPYRATVFVPGDPTGYDRVTLPGVVWQTAGGVVAVVALAAVTRLLVRRRSAADLFLAGWLLIEVGGYFALSPFPAGRRVMGVAVVVGLLAARVVSRARRDHRPAGWLLPAGATAGCLFAALDGYEAWVEKAAAERAVAVARPADGGDVWFVGHWGFGFYAERAGMKPFVPGQTETRPGDRLVLPVYPTRHELHRPHPGWGVWYGDPPAGAEPLGRVVVDDRLSARTIPEFYGGYYPLGGRDRPRLVVDVYRFNGAWHPER